MNRFSRGPSVQTKNTPAPKRSSQFAQFSSVSGMVIPEKPRVTTYTKSQQSRRPPSAQPKRADMSSMFGTAQSQRKATNFPIPKKKYTPPTQFSFGGVNGGVPNQNDFFNKTFRDPSVPSFLPPQTVKYVPQAQLGQKQQVTPTSPPAVQQRQPQNKYNSVIPSNLPPQTVKYVPMAQQKQDAVKQQVANTTNTSHQPISFSSAPQATQTAAEVAVKSRMSFISKYARPYERPVDPPNQSEDSAVVDIADLALTDNQQELIEERSVELDTTAQ